MENEREQSRTEVMKRAGPALLAAVETLIRQVDDENASVSQRAAKEIVDLFMDVIMHEDERELIVRVVGAPEIGMAEAAR